MEVINITSPNRLNQLKQYLDNGSFTGCNSFFNDYIKHLWDLCNFIGYNYKSLATKPIPETKMQTITEEEMINLASEYLLRHNIKIDIQKLLESKTLELLPLTISTDEAISLGRVYKEKGKIKTKVSNDNTILSAGILIHELLHYYNEPKGKRSFTSDLFTEIPSYYNELIFFLELINSKYKKDAIKSIIIIQKLIYKESYLLYSIYKILYVYFNTKDISKEAYEELFDDGLYERTIAVLDEYVNQKRGILYETWTFAANPFYINYFMKYQEDPTSYDTITKLSDELNQYDINDCMLLLGYPTIEEFKSETKEYATKFLELIKQYHQELQKGKEQKI